MRFLVSKILWFLLALIWFLIGFSWITAKEYEPIHAQILGYEWEEAPENVKELILFIMRVCSGMCLGIGAITLFFIVGPLKKTFCCANVYLFLLNFISLLPLTLVNIHLRFFREPQIAEMNWFLASLSLVMAISAFIIGFEKCTVDKCYFVPGSKVGECCGSCSCKEEEKVE